MGKCQYRILVVEDNPVFVNLLRRLLAVEEGHQVATADNGLEALEVLENFKPDIIFVDWVMAKIAGGQFCRIIRSKAEFKKCYVVILSGMAAEAKDELLAAGADACIAKGPFPQTAEHIRRVLREGRCGAGHDFSKTILGLEDVHQRQATLELLKRNRHYESILQNMYDAVVVLTVRKQSAAHRKSAIVFANQAACSLLGVGEEVLLSSPLAAFCHEQDHPRLAEALEQGQNASVRFDDSNPLRINNRYVSAVFIPFEDGGDSHVTVVLRDITERKLLEQQQLMYNSLIQQSNDAIFVIDPESAALLFANRQAFKSLGYEEDCGQELSLFDISPRLKGRREWQWVLGEVRTTPAGITFESRHRRKDGSLFPVEVNARIVQYDGRDFVVAIARDISERQRALELILQERSKLEAVVNALDTGLTLQDRNFVVLYQNAQHRRLHGDQVGTVCYQSFHGRQGVCPGCLLEKCFVDGRSHHRETSQEAATGRRYLDVVASPFFDGNGAIIGGVETVRDITERKMLEKQVQQAQKMEAIGTLAGGIAHDFNNILAAIMGYSEMALQEIPKGSPVHDMLQHVVTGADRARDLVRQILTFSRKGDQVKGPMLLQPVIKEALKLLRATMPSTIAISHDIAANCGVVLADPTMIHQLVMNLCTNSLHAMQRHGGRLVIRLESLRVDEDQARTLGELPPGPYVQLVVSDTGHGINKSMVDHIFDPYYTSKATGEGTGLGLAVVHGIVHNLGGAITVDSKEGFGTTFAVLLPEHGGDYRQGPEADVVALRGEGHIMVVDDEPAVTAISARMLGRLGYRVSVFTSSTKALQAFTENPQAFDLVIADQTMPEYTGMELLDRMKDVRPDIPVLLMSGYIARVDDESSQLMGLGGYLAKPFKEHEICNAVRSCFEKK